LHGGHFDGCKGHLFDLVNTNHTLRTRQLSHEVDVEEFVEVRTLAKVGIP
jgi:hypothetical protein